MTAVMSEPSAYREAGGVRSQISDDTGTRLLVTIRPPSGETSKGQLMVLYWKMSRGSGSPPSGETVNSRS